MNEHSAGFTILEVILFLAISGMLLLGAFIGMRSGILNTQFNDTTDSTRSYLQKQYLEVATGVNSRSSDLMCNPSNGAIVHDPSASANPGASSCVVLGRLFQFSSGGSEITSRYLSSKIVPDIGSISDIEAFGPGGYQVVISNDSVPQLRGKFELPWTAMIKTAKRYNSVSLGTIDVQSLAIMRSPVSERMMIYAFPMHNPVAAEFANANNLLANNNSLRICLYSDDSLFAKKALLNIGPGQGQDLFEIDRTSSGLSHC